MKILLVNKFHYLKGGSEKYYFELAKLLKENGHEICFFSTFNKNNIKPNDKTYFVDEIDMNNGSKLNALNIIYSFKNKKIIKKVLEEFKPDIVHINNFQRQLSASIIDAIKEKNIPIVFTAHDLQAICPSITMLDNNKQICEKCFRGKYYNCIKNKCNKNSRLKSIIGAIEGYYYRKSNIYTKKIDVIITPSHFYKTMLIKDGINENKIKVLHNFIDINNKEYKNNLGNYALYIGRLSKEKGILNLIEAFSKLNKGILHIAGIGDEYDNIKNYIENQKLEKRIKLLGYLNKDEIAKEIIGCKFVVVPSIWYENCPYSILETLSLGKTIIGSNIGGISELIEDKKTGLLYEPNNIEDLKEKIKLFFEDDNLVNTYSNNAKKFAQKNFSKQKYYKKIIKVYNDLLK